jgi:hypothetical protein
MTKMDTQKLGGWAFVLGVLIAVVAGLAAGAVTAYAGWIALALVVLGLVVGFLNIGAKEVNDFLIAAIALSALAISAAGLNVIPYVGAYLVGMVQNVAAFVAPAALVVALKAIYALAKEPS